MSELNNELTAEDLQQQFYNEQKANEQVIADYMVKGMSDDENEEEENVELNNDDTNERSTDTNTDDTDTDKSIATDEEEGLELPDDGSEEEKETTDSDLEIEIDEPESSETEIQIPESFESIEEERDFYKNQFENIKNKGEDSFDPMEIVNKYEDKLIEKEKNVEELRQLNDLINGKPEYFIKARFKNELKSAGYNPSLSEEDQAQYINDELTKVFGANYKNLYDPDEASDSSTLSYKMYKHQEHLMNEIENFNSDLVPQQGQAQPQGDPEEAKKFLEEGLTKAGISEKSVNRFVEDFKTQGAELFNDPVKLYKAFYMDKIIEKKVAQAKEEGRKEALAEIQKVGSKTRNYPSKTEQMKSREPDFHSNRNYM